ncbi:MAG: hypothetical protein U9O53_03660 [archaeon]|nr:hypothetical protein [archaeon]
MDVFDKATQQELEGFESLFPKLLGVSGYYSELENINNQYSEVVSKIEPLNKSLSNLAVRVQKAIEVMDSEKIEVTAFSDGVTPSLLRVWLAELHIALGN